MPKRCLDNSFRNLTVYYDDVEDVEYEITGRLLIEPECKLSDLVCGPVTEFELYSGYKHNLNGDKIQITRRELLQLENDGDFLLTVKEAITGE